MHAKIKLIITLLVFLITCFIFYQHYLQYDYSKSIIIITIGVIMIFGLWILPEATAKKDETNEEK